MALTDTHIRNTKPGRKTQKLTDSGGLYLEVTPAGGRLWRYRFKLAGKESACALGEYPRIGLAEARKLRDEAKDLVRQGINPNLQRKQDKVRRQHEHANTFAMVADEWYEEKSNAKGWSQGYAHHVKTIIEKDLKPLLGSFPIKDIKTPTVFDVVQRVVKRGAATRAILARQIIAGVFKRAILTHRAEYNPADPLKGEIARRVVEHHKHLDERDLPDFLRKLEDYSGHRQTAIALKLLLLTAVRPGELCGALWAEFDLDGGEWRIPGARMKMRRPHTVPLSAQTVALLQELKILTGDGKPLFPNQGTKGGTMPTATLRNAVVKLGYADKFSPHGARGTFSVLMNQAGFHSEVIERQLAHEDGNKVRASCHHATFMEERRSLMQAWADMLDTLRVGANVLRLRRRAA